MRETKGCLMREVWDRIGLTKSRLTSLAFDCDPAMELRIEALATKSHTFWLAFSDLLQPEFFANRLASAFIRLVHKYAEKYSVPPDHSTMRDLVRRASVITDDRRAELLQHVDSVYSTPLVATGYVQTIVQEMARKRAVRAGVCRIAELNEQSGIDNTVEISDVMSAVLSIGRTNAHPILSLKDDLGELLAGFDAQAKLAVPTNIVGLDGVLHGGLLPGELGVILAAPHVGKTFYLVNIGTGAFVRGFDTVYCTLEDGIRGVGPRLLARLSGIGFAEYMKDPGAAMKSLTRLMGMMHADLRLVYRPPQKTTIKDLGIMLDQLREQKNEKTGTYFSPKLLIIDYADRLAGVRKREKRYEELEDLYMALTGFAAEQNIAVWTGSQTNRPAYNKDVVDMGDFGGSFAKAAEADVVIAISQTRGEKTANEMRLHVTKARNRPSGQIIHVFTKPETSTMTEVPPDQKGALIFYRKKKEGGASPTPGPPLKSPMPSTSGRFGAATPLVGPPPQC